MPKSRLDFWEPKLQRNVERDRLNQDALKEAGWRVFTIWECETEKPDCIARLINDIKTLT